MSTHDNYDPDYPGWDNNIKYSSDFIYPNDDDPDSERTFDITVQQAIIRFSVLLFASDTPKVTLAALLYSCGTDVGMSLSCQNTETEIAKALGVSKQSFSWTVKTLKKQFSLNGNTGKSPSCKSTYSQTNYRPTKQK